MFVDCLRLASGALCQEQEVVKHVNVELFGLLGRQPSVVKEGALGVVQMKWLQTDG